MRKNEAGAGQGVSVIALGARVVGNVHTTGVVQIAGSVVGNVRADRQVLVAKGGVVDGDIETSEAILGGEVRGQIHAVQRVAVQASAALYGTISTPRLAVEEGATLDVDLSMGESRALLPLPTDALQTPPDSHGGSSYTLGRCRSYVPANRCSLVDEYKTGLEHPVRSV